MKEETLKEVARLAYGGQSNKEILKKYPHYCSQYGFKFIKEIRDLAIEERDHLIEYTNKRIRETKKEDQHQLIKKIHQEKNIPTFSLEDPTETYLVKDDLI